MMSFVFKDRISLSIFGSSHGNGIGCVIDGIPAGFSIRKEIIEKWMARRAPAQSSITTQRKESDTIEILSGINDDNFTDGGAITVFIRNTDQITKHYDDIRDRPRPGHGDLGLYLKYGPYRNYSGGGFLSGRMTAPLVAAGSIALQIIEQIGMHVSSYITDMGELHMNSTGFVDDSIIYGNDTRIPDEEINRQAIKLLKELMSDGDSTGGIIKTVVINPKKGMGEPFFDSVESIISHLMFSVPGVKGIEFGDGFDISHMKGSEANDPFIFEDGEIKSRGNHNGGILGGITYGNSIEFNVAMKPTSSIRMKQDTVNMTERKADTIIVQGRHDPCIAIRAVPVVKCVTAFALLDLYLRRQSMYKGNFENESCYR